MTENRSKPDQYQLRFPPGMRDRLKAAAIGNGRSMNAEIISRLEESFDPEVHKALHERGYLLGAVEGLIEAKFEELFSRQREVFRGLEEVILLLARMAFENSPTSDAGGADELAKVLKKIAEERKTTVSSKQDRR